MAEYSLESVHVSTSLQKIESEAVAQIMAAPSLHGGVLPLEDLDRLVNLTAAQKPPKLAHKYHLDS